VVSGQQHAPAALYPREIPGTDFTGGLVGSRAGLDGRKISSHRDSLPDRPARIQSLYQLSYPVHSSLLVYGDIIHVNTIKSSCDIMSYSTNERIFSRQTVLERLRLEMDSNVLCFYEFILKKVKKYWKIDSVASSGGQGQLAYSMCTHWTPAWSRNINFNFCFLYPSDRKLLFLTETWLIICWSPKEITLHQAIVIIFSTFVHFKVQ